MSLKFDSSAQIANLFWILLVTRCAWRSNGASRVISILSAAQNKNTKKIQYYLERFRVPYRACGVYPRPLILQGLLYNRAK